MSESSDATALPIWFRAVTSAERLMEVGRHDMAEKELRRALQQGVDDPALHVALGLALQNLNRPQEARDEAAAALALEPDNVQAMALLADIAHDAGQHQQAERHLLDALRIMPNHSGLLFSYSNLMRKIGQLDKAEKLVRAGLQLDPQHAGAHSLLTLILTELRNKKLAHEHGAHGLKLAPNREQSHLALGASYLATGHPFKARRHLREALRLNPGNSDIEEIFLLADRAVRWTYLPYYYWSLLLDRLPGKQFLVWGLVVVAVMVMRSSEAPSKFAAVVFLPYMLFCMYTWVANSLTSMWIRIRPPRL